MWYLHKTENDSTVKKKEICRKMDGPRKYINGSDPDWKKKTDTSL